MIGLEVAESEGPLMIGLEVAESEGPLMIGSDCRVEVAEVEDEISVS